MDLGQIAGYRLTAILGEGGQGVVYHALDPSGGEVAIKVLKTTMSEEAEEHRRFFRQVDLARRVAPFCTARVLDMGLYGEQPYIVSEYVRGESLERVVRREGPRTGGALERVAVATATALAAIHRAGVVHRDLKPGNVMLGPEGPVVIDFGISQPLGHIVTQSGVFGTPGYMAPEQLGDGTVGPPADVFSWGVTMVFAATGRPAFAGASVPAVIHALLYGEPDLTGVPPTLEPLIRACLNRDPARRPTADELVRALTGGTVVAVAATPLKRRRFPAAAVVAIAVAIAGSGVAVALWPRLQPPDPVAARSQTPSPSRTQDPTATPSPSATVFGAALGPPLAGHSNDVRAAAIGLLKGSPVALTGSDDESARLWDLRTSKPVGEPLTGHTEWVRGAALDQLDGAPIALTAADDDTARVWDLTTRRSRVLRGHGGDVKALATTRIGSTHVALTASADGTARVWDLRTARQLGAPLTGHRGGVWSVTAGQLGGVPVAVTTGDDATVRVWDLRSRKQLGAPMTGHSGWARSVALGNLDGIPVAITGGEDTTVRVWNLATRRQQGPPLTGHTGPVWSVAAGNLAGVPVAVTGGEDSTVRVWNLRTGKALGTPFTGHSDSVWSVATGLLDGRPIAVSGSRDQTARVWNLTSTG